MSARNRLIMVAVAAAFVNLLFFFFFIRGRQGELGDVREQIEAAESQTQQLNAQLARLEELEGGAARLEAQLADIRSQVPEEDEVSNFIFQVQEAADEAGVDFVQITPELPKPPPEGASLAQTRVVVGAEGGFFSLQDFLRRLYELDRAVRIDNLTLATQEGVGGSSLALSATARIFFELPAGGAAGTTTTTTTTTTTAPPAPAPAPASPSPTPTVEEE